MDQSSAIEDAARAEYDAWIRSDWTVGADSTKFNALLRHQIYLHQVVSSLDVSVSKHRQLGNEDDDDGSGDEDRETEAMTSKATATRMLRLLLFDGRNYQTAYEYEPIACLDVFHANRMTGNPVRCCGKIALFNAPVERRGSFWLTRSNVKLVFEGYECRHHCEPGSQSPVAQLSQEISDSSTAPPRPAVQRSSISGPQADHDEPEHTECVSYNVETSQKRSAGGLLDFELPVKRFNAHTVDSRHLTPLEQYFPSGSSFLKFSYTSYLVHANAAPGDSSYEQFANHFLRVHGFTGRYSIAQALSNINKSSCFSEPTSIWLDDDAHFGFLNHAVPLDVVDRGKVSDFACSDATTSGFMNGSRIWLVHLDDCTASFFCLVSLETLGLSAASYFATSRLINSTEGYFEVKRLNSDGSDFYWISKYRRYLDDDEFARRTQAIQADFERMESLLDF
ncbi:methionine aminopeptidase [Babesia caballi]|uniref:Methionine aminopeptidase n=1 Tax=Babesia caballi TaxID=5871 RepID=A0AAV4M0W3_BABCB|nr:methionine aminopeptidase [Babesia caballi]